MRPAGVAAAAEHAVAAEPAAAAAPADAEPPPPAILPELSHNLALLVDLDDLELAKRERALKQERDALAALTQRRDALASAARQRSASLAKLSDVRDALADCATAAAAAAAGDCDALADAAERWARLRAAAPAEFAEWRLHELALSAVAPGARALYAAWTPLEQPALGVEAMRRWQRALAPLPGGGGARRESSSGGPSARRSARCHGMLPIGPRKKRHGTCATILFTGLHQNWTRRTKSTSISRHQSCLKLQGSTLAVLRGLVSPWKMMGVTRQWDPISTDGC